jgi:2-dehydropantoate 2-reductase
MSGGSLKIAVMGPGGVGGYFGGRLAEAGNDVTFVARGSHLEAMKKNGLVLDSEIRPAHLKPVKVVADAREIDTADVIMFAVKMRDTESAAESLTGLTSKGATVFTFQNGVESADRIGRIVGAEHVVPGVARIGSHISAPGTIKQTGKFESLEFAERDGKPSARVTAFADACKAAGFAAKVPANIQREVWMKFAMLAPLSGLTALTRGPIGPVRTNPQSRALLEAAVKETVAVGVALKTGLTPADADDLIKLVDGLPKNLMASMAHDLVAGKPIEIDGLSGAVARLGQAAGAPAPTHTFIAQALAPFRDGPPKV